MELVHKILLQNENFIDYGIKTNILNRVRYNFHSIYSNISVDNKLKINTSPSSKMINQILISIIKPYYTYIRKTELLPVL